MKFVGLAAHDRDQAMEEFVATFGLEGMLTLVDDDGSLWRHFGVRFQPAWAFISVDGDVEVVAGALSSERLDERLRRLVAPAS